jgi:hypothetical protein
VVPSTFTLDVTGMLDGGVIQLPVTGPTRRLEPDPRPYARGAAQVRWPATSTFAPHTTLTLTGIWPQQGPQNLKADLALPNRPFHFYGDVSLTTTVLRFTGEGSSPWVLEATLAAATLNGQSATGQLTLSGTVTVAPDCRRENGLASPLFCGAQPFLNLAPHSASLPRRPVWDRCPQDLVDAFVDGTESLFDGQQLSIGTATAMKCRTTPAGTDERPAYLCEGQRSGVMSAGCSWTLDAFAVPSISGELFSLLISGVPEGGTCEPCTTRWVEE